MGTQTHYSDVEVPLVTFKEQENVVQIPVALREEHIVETPEVRMMELTRQVLNEAVEEVPVPIPVIQTQVVEKAVPVRQDLIHEIIEEVPQYCQVDYVTQVSNGLADRRAPLTGFGYDSQYTCPFTVQASDNLLLDSRRFRSGVSGVNTSPSDLHSSYNRSNSPSIRSGSPVSRDGSTLISIEGLTGLSRYAHMTPASRRPLNPSPYGSGTANPISTGSFTLPMAPTGGAAGLRSRLGGGLGAALDRSMDRGRAVRPVSPVPSRGENLRSPGGVAQDTHVF